ASIENGSINLIVTSPPYPKIKMWDQMFSNQNSEIAFDIESEEGIAAFNKMHRLLDEVWEECDRVLANNGFVCINIGDATRTINNNFQLFSNHTKIINKFLNMGYSVLPDILWRKQSNSPTKFMGSGMYPAGAYVTYEHEYILVFRKGGKRVFKGEEKKLRQKSAFFWEERNVWFSDLWDIKGTSQTISASKTSRARSAAFPFEIPYRLVNMYSVEGDTVLDPFAGLGTTTLACMATKRNSYGVEIDLEIAELAMKNIADQYEFLNQIIETRIANHLIFISELSEDKKSKCYTNIPHGFPVKTRQETAIKIDRIESVTFEENIIYCKYE
ncbi:MAG: site-specific DNA-methyltransferase, partial [Alkaliphilus sp.]|nr:site-specific DNA-methyltransferase [Alkaliphilus sp.]